VAPEVPLEVQKHEKDDVLKKDGIVPKKPRSPTKDRQADENPR
jgi:hypothetical protein